MSPTFLKCNTRIQGIYPMVVCAPWSDSFVKNQNNYQIIDKKTKMIFCSKALDNSLNHCEGLTQWDFVPLRETLLFATSELNNLRNFLNKINVLIVKGAITKTGTLSTFFHKPEEESNPYVWFGIRTTAGFQSHPRTGFSINLR